MATDAMIVKAYVSGKGMSVIARECAVGNQRILDALRDAGVDSRKRGQRYVMPDKGLFAEDCKKMRWHELEVKYGVQWNIIKSWKRKFGLTDGKKHDREILWLENPDGCWKCTSHKKSHGYPRAKKDLVVRILWVRKNGDLEEGDALRHLCGHNWCVNPDHTVVGTQFENVVDAVLDGRKLLKDGPRRGVLNKAYNLGLIDVDLLGHVITRKSDGKIFDRIKYKFVNGEFISGEVE